MAIFSVEQLASPWQACGATHVAVYGTLRAGGVNDIVRLRPDITPVGQTWLMGSLYDLGHYPGLCLSGDQAVLAEVYPIDAPLEKALDGIEGLWPTDVGEYVKRILSQPVRQGDGSMVVLDVLVYEAVPDTVASCPRIGAPNLPDQPLDWLSWAAAQGRVPPDGEFTLRTAQ